MATPPARSPGPAAPDGATAREVYPLVADLMRHRPALYHLDLAASAALAWGALLAAAADLPRPRAWLLFAVGALALYRAASFTHEVTHLKPGQVPGFALAWNALVGVPLLFPSMLYVGVHSIHHAKGHYGTEEDPEYLPIGHWPAWRIALWVLHAGAVPVALAVRFLLLAPLSLVHPRLRGWVWARASSLTINPAFRRPPLPAGARVAVAAQEAACFGWALALALLTARAAIPLRVVAVLAAAVSAAGILNQLRTCVSHRFRNEGASLSFEAQFLDSLNVPGHRVLGALWAPVGLRYHSLHHLLPALPYHALGAAHRRVLRALPPDAPYARAGEPTLAAALASLLRRPFRAAS